MTRTNLNPSATRRRVLALIALACLAGLAFLPPLTFAYAQPALQQEPTLTPVEWPDTEGTPALALTPLTELPLEEQGDTSSALIFGLVLVFGMGALLILGIGAAILMERFQRTRRR
jgi:hypothetical protein